MSRHNINKEVWLKKLRLHTLQIGFIAGVAIVLLELFFHYFNFTELSIKSIFLRSWIRETWTSGMPGSVIAICIFLFLSVLGAFVYYIFFKKVNSIWMGAAFGGGIWLLEFLLIHPRLPNLPPTAELDEKTIVTTICLYVIYGVFTGYTISYNYKQFRNDDMGKSEK